ncbi:MAG: SMP-30/gluconolactonase/LRE family protein [Alphaproteobacteria bacterium]
MVEYLIGRGAALGECPVWDAVPERLYWIDGTAPALLSCDINGGGYNRIALGEKIGSFALRAKGGAVAALESGFAFLDLESGALAPIADPEADLPENRFNDGKCDPGGRFWAGTMHASLAKPTGALYRLDPGGGATRMLGGLSVPNGLAWSPDGTLMYFADSLTGAIQACDFDADEGGIGEPRVFAEPGSAPGFPDGACVDAEGLLWSARWRGGCLARYAPDGSLDRTVALPVSRVTSCAFAGPRLETLMITTASAGLSDEERKAEPLAGGLFVHVPGVRGLPEPRFAG